MADPQRRLHALRDPGCLKACPAPGAIIQYANRIVDFHQENCIGCGYCVSGCPFNVPRISQKDSKAYKCTLCSDRVAVGLEPACVKVCPTGSISFGSKGRHAGLAAERVTELKERGFKNAGLLRPGRRGWHSTSVVRAQPRRQARAVQRPASRPDDRATVTPLEERRQTPRDGRHGRRGAGRPVPLRDEGPNEVSKEIEAEVERELEGEK